MAGSAIPGVGPLIAVASKILTAKLGKPIDSSAEGITNALQDALGDPAQHAALLESEQAYQQALQQMGYQNVTDMAQIAAQDRASARSMQVQTHSWTPSMLAWAAVGTMMGCIYLLGFRAVPVSGKDALLILLGAVTVTYKDVYGYFFGSSAGSAAKTEIMANGNGH